MVRFIHTADNHLGSPFKGLTEEYHSAAERAIEASYTAFQAVVNRAISEKVDFVLIVGDLYDATVQHTYEMQFVIREFERLESEGILVFLIHGNHDYGINQDIWLPANVKTYSSEVSTHVITTRLGECVAVSGFSYENRWLSRSVAKEFPMKFKHVDFHIGLYHGEMAESGNCEKAYAPFSISDLKRVQYDYWALGHIHQRMALSMEPPIIYSGNTQGRSFKELGEKGAYLVECSKGEKVKLQFFQTDVIDWQSVEVSLLETETVLQASQTLLATLSELEHSTHQFIRLILKVNQHYSQPWLNELKLLLQRLLDENRVAMTLIEVQINRQESRSNGEVFRLTQENSKERLDLVMNQLMQHPLIVRYLSEELAAYDFRDVIETLALERLIQEE